MPSPLNVSIVVCTRDKAESLAQTLESIARTAIPGDFACELLIVDNGPGEATRLAVANCPVSNMPVRYVVEPRKGLAIARNHALNATDGQILLFTDDDVRVPRNWIEGMCRPIADKMTDAIAGGVRIPANLRRLIGSNYGWFASTEEISCERPDRIVGANMAFGRHVLDRIPCFDEELGAGQHGFFEDTLFSWQLLTAGYKIISRFDVEVDHHFEQSRTTHESMLRTADRMARSQAYVEYHWKHSKLSNIKLFFAHSHLWARRIRHQWFAGERGLVWELCKTFNASFKDQFLVEEKYPHKYELRGLIKRSPQQIVNDDEPQTAIPSVFEPV
jgi:glycosyltransferase involved in cell wall biosynthesis